jgi:hypothetical protein
MNERSDFWHNIHYLAESYESAGLTADERAAMIVEEFRSRPALAQRELFADLATIVGHVPDICPLLASAISRETRDLAISKRIASH